MDGFPRALPTTIEQRAVLYDQLKDWRAAHLSWLERVNYQAEPLPSLDLGAEFTDLYTPSMSTGYLFTPQPPPAFDCTPGNCRHLTNRTPRPCPEAFLSRCHKTVYLSKIIHADEDCWSQVFLGRLGPEDSPSSVNVVVKIYQMSMVGESSLSLLKGGSKLDPWDCTLQTFRQEGWAYECMKSIQGAVVPHVLGFFDVLMPNGEPSIALVMEYIESCRQGYYARHVGSSNRDRIASLAKELLLAIHSLHTCGVVQLDTAARNVLLPSTTPSQPVLIDFNFVSDVKDEPLSQCIPYVAEILVDIGFSAQLSCECLEELLSDENQDWATLFNLAGIDGTVAELVRGAI